MQASENKPEEIDEAIDAAPIVKFHLSRKMQFAVGLVLANVVVIAILALFFMRQSRVTKTAEPPVAPLVDPLRTTSRADGLLLSGRTAEAMELYRIAAKTRSRHATAITYRLALGMELLGDLKGAAQYYQIVNNQDFTETSLAARLGEARVYYKLGEFKAASQILSPLAGVSVLPALSQTTIGVEVSFMRALALSAWSQAALPRSIMDPHHLFQETLQLSVDEALRLVPLEGSQLGMPIPIGDDTRIGVRILGTAREPDTTLVTCGLRNQTASVLLELIARETGWKVAITPSANEVLSAKRVEVQLRDKTVGELLSIVLEPQGLFWIYDGDTLVVDRIENFPEETVVLRRRNHATALLLNSLAEAPSHSLAPQAYLALGNLAAMSQRFERASTFYQDARERYPKHLISQRASLNLAKMLLKQSKKERAEDILYEVVDGRGNFELAPLAFLLLGDMHLAAEDLDAAKRELSRSVALAKTREVTAAAAMTLASVYLLKRSENAASTANAVLMEHREVLRDPRWSDAVIFLSSLTRYRVANMTAERNRRGRELISAAVKVKPGSFFGGYGYLLVGDAFSELSLVSEATRVYREGLEEDIPESLHDMLLYRLATEYRNQNDFASARIRLQELSAKVSSGLAPIAAVDLADMLLQNGELPACVRHCRAALQRDFAEPHQIKLLKTLGRAYEELGNYELASLCFAGFLPAAPTAEVRR